MNITEFAPAKINLSLHVTGRRADGYHLLESLVVFADVGDYISISTALADNLAIEGPFAASLQGNGANLVEKARDQLRERVAFGPVDVRLTKNLPVSSGIGGGSSDAAATLRALSRLFGLSQAPVADVAIGLGADVPMCLAAKTLVAKGIGEQLTAATGLPELHMVIVNPNVPVSTPDVFSRLSNHHNPALPPIPEGLSFTEFAEWLSRTRNDLQLPALQICPAIGDALIALAETGPLLARMSGSGATCYGLFSDASSAAVAANAISGRYENWWVMPAKAGDNINGHR